MAFLLWILMAVAMLERISMKECKCKKEMEACREKMKEVKIIPKHADPKYGGGLQITYADNKTVDCGNNLAILTTKDAPTVKYNVRGKCDELSLIMFDLDAPLVAPYLHWWVANIPAKTLKSGFHKQTGRKVATYFPPLGGTGNHRYVFCVYCQTKTITKCGKSDMLSRARQGMNFDLEANSKAEGLCRPDACNFFYLDAIETNLPEMTELASVWEFYEAMGNSDKIGDMANIGKIGDMANMDKLGDIGKIGEAANMDKLWNAENLGIPKLP